MEDMTVCQSVSLLSLKLILVSFRSRNLRRTLDRHYLQQSKEHLFPYGVSLFLYHINVPCGKLSTYLDRLDCRRYFFNYSIYLLIRGKVNRIKSEPDDICSCHIRKCSTVCRLDCKSTYFLT